MIESGEGFVKDNCIWLIRKLCSRGGQQTRWRWLIRKLFTNDTLTWRWPYTTLYTDRVQRTEYRDRQTHLHAGALVRGPDPDQVAVAFRVRGPDCDDGPGSALQPQPLRITQEDGQAGERQRVHELPHVAALLVRQVRDEVVLVLARLDRVLGQQQAADAVTGGEG